LNKTFGQLFEGLTSEYKMVPLGLYRAIHTKKNNKSYVYLKPTNDTILLIKDRVYVLSIK